jgi:hypothetical protein
MRLIFILLCLSLLSACSSLESEAEIMRNFANIETGLPKDKAKLQKQGQMLIAIPEEKAAEMPVLFIFGGMYYANPNFMLKNTPQELFEKAVLVFAPCRYEGGQGFDVYKKQLMKFLKKQGISIRELSVCGFSGGGPDALEAQGPDLKVVGLIDAEPILPKKKGNRYPNIINAFNKKNWFDNEAYGESSNYKYFDRFAAWTKKEGGLVEEAKVKHEFFPKYFLYKYRKRLLS